MSSFVLQFEHPRSSAQRVAQQVKHVQINHDAIGEFAKKIQIQMQDTIFNLKDWKSAELHPKIANEHAIRWIFFVDALNFSFWPSPNCEYSVTYQGTPYTGYWSLCAAVNRALDEGIPLIDPNYYKSITVDEMAYILRADQPNLTIPLVEERVNVLHECARVLFEKYEGSFVNCIQKANQDAEQLLKLIVTDFKPFQDYSEYKGTKVFLLKRAQILIADIWACFEGEELGYFKNIETITMFADYRVPQVLAYFDVLQYSDELSKILIENRQLKSGDEMEVEIRAQSIHAVELLREALHQLLCEKSNANEKSTKWLNSIVIDFYLWNFRQAHRKEIELAVPFHRTRSINY